MRRPTELMKSILTNDMAQRMIDFVSPIYGDSYVALWIYQAIGSIMGDVYNTAYKLRYETSASTADLLLDYWEMAYGLPTDSSLTKEDRRERIISKILNRGPVNRVKMTEAVSTALGGVEVEITENVDRNKFLVNVRETVPSIVPAVSVIERMKPAHLVYEIRVATQMVSDAEIKTAIAMTHAEIYRVEVIQ